MNKNVRPRGEIAAIIISIAAAAVIVTGLIAGAVIIAAGGYISDKIHVSNVYGDYGLKDYTEASDIEITEDDIDTLDIDWVSGSITLKYSEDGSFSVHESGNIDGSADVMRYKINGGQLSLKFREPGIYSNSLTKDLVIEIPGGKLKKVRINSVDSDISVFEQHIKELKIDVVSGNIDIDGSDISEFDAESISANVYCDFSEQPHDVNINTVSGDVELKLPETPEDLELESLSGEIEVNGARTKHEYESDSSDGSGDISVETISGNIFAEIG